MRRKLSRPSGCVCGGGGGGGEDLDIAGWIRAIVHAPTAARRYPAHRKTEIHRQVRNSVTLPTLGESE